VPSLSRRIDLQRMPSVVGAHRCYAGRRDAQHNRDGAKPAEQPWKKIRPDVRRTGTARFFPRITDATALFPAAAATTQNSTAKTVQAAACALNESLTANPAIEAHATISAATAVNRPAANVPK
jgi:hypothetical protein